MVAEAHGEAAEQVLVAGGGHVWARGKVQTGEVRLSELLSWACSGMGRSGALWAAVLDYPRVKARTSASVTPRPERTRTM